MKSLYIVPTRERPQNVARLMRAVDSTIGDTDTWFFFCVDDDDSMLIDYHGVLDNSPWHDRYRVIVQPRMSIVEIMNVIARQNTPEWVDVIGFMGDDHVPQTPRWDVALGVTSRGGVAYGNDLLQGQNLPTAVAIDSRVIHALGFMAPPTLKHMYVDNFWKDLGQALNRLTYNPDIIIEHMHPVIQKTEWDEGYERVAQHYADDEAAYRAYMQVNFASDVSRVIAARADW